MSRDWSLRCVACGLAAAAHADATVCTECGQPWLVEYAGRPHPITERAAVRRGHSMWRFRSFLPINDAESPVSLGEGDTPLIDIPRTGEALGLPLLQLKDEGTNPTGSFKARGLSAAVTRAALDGASGFVLPTAGNAGVAASAYGARAGLPVQVFAPTTTPPRLLEQIEWFGGGLTLIDGHIGDCGAAAKQHALESGWVDLSTLREPYRIEGKKTMGLELAMQLNWALPEWIVYPTGGGTGLIGMYHAFRQLQDAGWTTASMPRFVSVQSEGCAPVVRAFVNAETTTGPWSDPQTMASGLRVPSPLGGRLILQALYESGGAAVAVTDAVLTAEQRATSRREGLDLSPEGGAALAAAALLREAGTIAEDARVLVFNTGAGWLYR